MFDENRNWQKDFTDAPKDEPICVLVPTGDASSPLLYEIASWEDGQWDGSWATAYPDAQPVAWCFLPDIDDDIATEYELPVHVSGGEAAA